MDAAIELAQLIAIKTSVLANALTGEQKMLSSKHNFIFVHVPKTAGNSINRYLLPVCDNEIYTEKFHDGVNQFGISGAYSKDKHSPLSVYKTFLGELFPSYKVLISVRHPFPRALSYYFSPNRWFREKLPGKWELTPPHWDENAFWQSLSDGWFRSCSSYLDVIDRRKADFVIRQENLADDLSSTLFGLNIPDGTLKPINHVNRTSASPELLNRLLKSKSLRDEVETFQHEDMEAFNYDSYVPRAQ